MRVLVTGATGFVGCHTVAALKRRSHDVRVLARSPDRVPRALIPVGASDVDVVAGDVTDADAVARAVEGCDAVVHAANVYTFDPRRHEEMHRVNRDGTALVLDAALAAGVRRIVHVSSLVVLLPPRGGTIPADAPLGTDPGSAYVSSKFAAERVARDRQERGAPVVITYPSAVWGPHDPGPGEMVEAMTGFLANRYPYLVSSGGMGICDVRWVAEAHAALVTESEVPPRVVLGGAFAPWTEWYELLRGLTGSWLPRLIPTPRAAALATGAFSDLLRRTVGFGPPGSWDGTWVTLNMCPTDDRHAIHLIGAPPPLADTTRDAIAWAVAAGHVSAALAGRLASEVSAEAP